MTSFPSHSPRRSAAIFALLFASFLISTHAASAGVLEDRLAGTQAEKQDIKSEIQEVNKKEQKIRSAISRYNDEIEELTVPINRLGLEIRQVSDEMDARRTRIAQLQKEFVAQQREIAKLALELRKANEVLSARVVAAYKSGSTGVFEQLLASGDVSDMFARGDAMEQMVGVDQEIIDRIDRTERKVRMKRAKNQDRRRAIETSIKKMAADRASLDLKRDELDRQRAEVSNLKSIRNQAIETLNEREETLGQRYDALEDDVQSLKDAIKAGEMNYSGAIGRVSASGSGMIWPVSGPVVSPFGPRWGRMHEGIDIAAPAGVAIIAAAPGVVTHAGPMSGYGNLVIVQHSGGLSTSYAHQSQIVTAVGQVVGQGQLLGYVGCTGHCYGDHLHFETRVNGSAQDPMQYL